MKKIKFCTKISDYETPEYSKYIYIILDFSRIYLGLHFAIDSKKVNYGELICENTGVNYNDSYIDRKIYKLRLYHYCKAWKEKGWKPRWVHLSVIDIKKKV